VTFRLPEESTSPESTHPFRPLETTIENFPAPDDPGPDDTDRDSDFDLILEDPLEPEDDFALDLMSALYKKRKSQLVMIPVEINGTSVTALIDSGAQGIFVSKSVAKKLKGVSYDPSSSVSIRSVTGEIVRCPNLVKEAFLRYSNGSFSSEELIVAPIKYDLILGITWLHDINPSIDWRTKTLTFLELPERLKPSAFNFTQKPEHPKTLTLNHCELVSGKAFEKIMKKEKTDCFVLYLSDLTSSSNARSEEERECCSLDIVSEFPSVFPSELPKTLPPERSVDHRIDLLPDSRPISRSPYRLSAFEEAEVRKTVEELLSQGVIRPSTSPWAAPVLFSPKKDGKLRFCVDYRALNKQTIRNYFPIPRADTLIDRTKGSRIFSVIDLWSAYHQVLVHKRDIPKTAFVTPFGHYEYLVVPFGLTNAPSTFQTLMNNLFGHLPFVSVYLDDILIFSRNAKEHAEHLRQVLKTLRDNKLHAKLAKCKFFQTSVEFLGHILIPDGIRPCPDKIAAIKEWPIPTDLRSLQSFLGFVNYYRHFIDKFAMNATPLNALLNKHTPFTWTSACQKAFETLRDSLISEPVLKIFEPELETRIETDASGFAIGSVLTQKHKDGWHPVAFLSRSMTAPEKNYPIQEQELLALIYALKKWRHYLFGMEITAYTDHETLVGWQSNRDLSGRKARWVETLSEFPVRILYRPGQQNIVADALSRRRDYELNQTSILEYPDLVSRIRSHYSNDEYFKGIYKYFTDEKSYDDLKESDQIPEALPSIIHWYAVNPANKLLYYIRDGEYRICIPREERK